MINPFKGALIGVVSTLLLASSCSEKEPAWSPRPKPEKADQTLLVYLSGQTLMGAFRTNIKEIQEAIDQHILYDSRLMVYVEPTTRESYLIEYSFDYATQKSRPDTLRRYNYPELTAEHIGAVMRDAFEEAPADRYGLITGSHGGGWVPSEYPYLSSDEEDNMEIWSHPKTLHSDRHPLLYKSAAAAYPTRWYGEMNGRVTDLETWCEAIQSLDISLEYLIFDACFMSNIEALYEMRHLAKEIVASPTEIMGRGMPYAKILKELFTEEGKSYDLEAYCRGYHAFYLTTTETQPSGTIALTRCEELEALAEVARAAIRGGHREVDATTLQRYEGLDNGLFYDLRQYMEATCEDESLLEEFRVQFDRTFPMEYRLYTPYYYSGYNGMLNPIDYYSGVSCSTPSTKYPTAYRETAWYRLLFGE